MTDPLRPATRLSWIATIFLALSLGLLFQGSRGLFEPDEGAYASASRLMSESGNWLIPYLNGEPFLDKPPLIHWGAATAMGIFGYTPFAARCFHALWFAATAWLVGLLAARIWGSRAGPRGIVVYSTMLGPFFAASVLTPDTLLAFWTTALLYAYWRYRTAPQRSQALWWSLALGLALAGGILSKGPAVFVFLPALAIHRLRWDGWRATLRPELIATGLFGIGLGATWYLTIGAALPGTLSYWWDLQIAGRLWSDQYDRSPEWWKGFEIYVPMLIAGSLPYTFGLWGDLRHGTGALFGRSPHRNAPSYLSRQAEQTEAHGSSLLVLAAIVPLVVLFAASSKLTLYALPLLAPLAVLATGRLRSLPIAPRKLAVGVVALLTLKALAGVIPSDRDGGRLANHMRSLGIETTTPILVIDTKFNVLTAYGFDNVRHTLLNAAPGAGWQAIFYVTPPKLDLPRVLAEIDKAGEVIFLTKTTSLGNVSALLRNSPLRARVLPSYDSDGILIRVSSRSPGP